VLVGAVLLAVLLVSIARVKVPYVEMGPGSTFDTLGQSQNRPIITVSGAPTSKSTGELRLVTIDVIDGLTLAQAMRSWWSSDYAVVPRELIYPPDQSRTEVQERDAEDFRESQSTAETAALRELGYPIEVTINGLTADGPAAAQLKVGDILVSVDGTPVDNGDRLAELIRAKPAGTAREVTYRRDGQTATVTLTPVRAEDGNPRLGVQVKNVQPHPFELKIELDRIGGPSAGLMFALAIIDLLKPEDLTGGFVIAGTGTIAADGKVGRIGGISHKLVSAKKAGAKLFLTPAANCADAVANAQPGLPLAKVETLDDALAAVEALRQKRTPVLCPS